MTRAKFNGVKVFSATMVEQRLRLGETVTEWIAAHPTFEMVWYLDPAAAARMLPSSRRTA